MNTNLRLLLQLIDKKADTSFLSSQGLEYSQISALFGEAIKQELLKFHENNFYVTDKGKQLLVKSAALANEGTQGQWISMDQSYKICELDISDIYLPTKKELNFL